MQVYIIICMVHSHNTLSMYLYMREISFDIFIVRVNIQFKGHIVSFGYSERIYELCGSNFFNAVLWAIR